MKKKLLLACLSVFFMNEQLKAQEDLGFKAFSEESSYVNLGYGIGNITQSLLEFEGADDYQSDYSSFGPIFAKYEYAITNKIGIGVNFAYAQAKIDYNYTNTYITDGSKLLEETLDWKSYSVLFRFNLHFGNHKKIDPYWGVGMGYRDATWSGYNNDPQSNYNNTEIANPFNMGFETTFGCRFLFSPNFGAYVEAGFAKAVMQFGLTGKF